MKIDRPNWVYASAYVLIKRPLGRTFDFVCDATNDPRWMPKVLSVQKLTSGPVGIGTRFRQTASLLGARVDAEWQITEYQTQKNMHGRSVRSPVPFEGGYLFSEGSGVTRIEKYANFDLSRTPPFLPLVVVSSLLEKEFQYAFERLKGILEREK